MFLPAWIILAFFTVIGYFVGWHSSNFFRDKPKETYHRPPPKSKQPKGKLNLEDLKERLKKSREESSDE